MSSAAHHTQEDPMTDEALEIRGLCVPRGGRPVVRDVSMRVPRGQVTALLGPNGAGKSSLVLAMAGVVRPTAGAVTIDGVDVTGWRPERVRAAGLATVPEGHRILGDLTVADNLRVASGALPKGERAAAIAHAQELFEELRALGERRAGSMSGGQQQMLAIAQALVGRPRYLVIDELSLGLAPVVVRRLIPALEQVAADGVGVLLIEQFTSLALSVATDAHALVRGRLRLSEPAARLREEPALLESVYHLASPPVAAG